MRETLPDLFARATAGLPAVRKRAAFGGTGWFVGPEMFALTWADRIVLKLSPEDRDRALSLEGACLFEPQGGRPMRSLVIMPSATFGHPDTLAAWVHKSHAFAAVAQGERAEGQLRRRDARTAGRSKRRRR